MPWAGTVQLLICAGVSRKKRFRVAEQFVADLEEPPTSFGSYGVPHQRERIAYVIREERGSWARQMPGAVL